MQRSTSITTRLVIYFLIIMAVPFTIFTLFYNYFVPQSLYKTLSDQAQLLIRTDGNFIENSMDSYRHSAYITANDPKISSALEDDFLTDEELEELSTLLRLSFPSNTKAEAHIISQTGNVRYSTGEFPSVYNFKYWSGSEINIFTIAKERREIGRSSFIYSGDHRVNKNGSQVIFSIFRNIYTKDNEHVGYMIVDVYTNAILSELTNGSLFKDVLLIDKTYNNAFSIKNPNIYGTINKFTFLTDNSTPKYSYNFILGSFSVVGYIDTEIFRLHTERILLAVILALSLGLIISIVLSVYFSASLTNRIRSFIRNLKYIENGNFDIYLDNTGISEIDELASSFNTMIDQIVRLIQERSEEASKAAEAERRALESQLNPHFIFNTLNTIKALAKLHGEDDIYTISLQLGKLLRSSLKNHSSTCLLSESISLTESYLRIQKIRFSDRLTYSINTNNIDTTRIIGPKLVIQPLVENSVVHALEPQNGSIHISVNIEEFDGKLKIVISDNGLGMEDNSIFNDMSNLKDSSHVGLYNIYRRLFLRYKENFTFKIETKLQEGFKVTMITPIEEV